ncbi:MAG: hypothetical protein JXX14_20720 [Deltaproteobacteria bacterium]|nr:hypothetical protein [Deltaproteobacteria bacterium]
MRNITIVYTIFCLITVWGVRVLADDGEVSDSACSPQCRDGFFCSDGKCVSPCNPPCPAMEVCTRNGKCIPEAPPPASQPFTPAPPSFQMPSNSQPQATVYYPYSTGTGQRITGGIFLAIGLINLVTAPICLSDMVDSELEEACLIGSLSIGGVMTLIGLPMLAAGNAKKRRYLEWREQQQSTSNGVGVRMSRTYGGFFWTVAF